MNFVPGNCERKSRAGGLRQTQINFLTDIETFELSGLEHRKSQSVKIIILVDYAFEYGQRVQSKSLNRHEAAFRNTDNLHRIF